MADNYLENQYENYQKRKALWEAKKKYSRKAVRENGQTDHETLHELHVLIRANDRPYNPFRKYLYSPASLYEGYRLGCPESWIVFLVYILFMVILSYRAEQEYLRQDKDVANKKAQEKLAHENKKRLDKQHYK